MKKKIMSIGGLLMLVLVLSCTLVLYFGCDNPDPEVTPFSITGTWKVITHGGARVEDEYLTFTDQSVELKKAGAVAGEGEYTFSETAGLTALGQTFHFEKKSDNFVEIATSPDAIWALVRSDSDSPAAIGKDALLGTWNVVIHGGTPPQNVETLTITADQMSYTSGSNTRTSEYVFENGKGTVSQLGLSISGYTYGSDTLFFVEDGTNYVWELSKAQ